MAGSTRTSAKILKKARALIEDPARWTQGEYARTADGERCTANSSFATCWCAYGALQAAAGRYDSVEEEFLRAAVSDLYRERDEVTVIEANDKIGHAAVLQIYDRAIELAEARSPSTP